MHRRGAGENGSNPGASLNRFVNVVPRTEGSVAGSSVYTHSAGEESEPQQNQQNQQTQQMSRPGKNNYTFKVRYPDKERTVFFPRDEVERLAMDIGVDMEHDKTTHIWFLQQALLSELPFDWQKEVDFQGRTIYHSALHNLTSQSHPSVHQLRRAFAQLLKAESVKRTLVQDALNAITPVEQESLQEKLNALAPAEQHALAKKIRATVCKDEERAAGELTKLIVKCRR
jgi:hypothetical protein